MRLAVYLLAIVVLAAAADSDSAPDIFEFEPKVVPNNPSAARQVLGYDSRNKDTIQGNNWEDTARYDYDYLPRQRYVEPYHR